MAMALLMLGVGRKREALGSAEGTLLSTAGRLLTPGQERGILEPLERALSIYKDLGNLRQASAVHYQLASFFNRVWLAQSDRRRARERLGAALGHYNTALQYFYREGVSGTIVLIVLDLSDLLLAVHTSSTEGEPTCVQQVGSQMYVYMVALVGSV
jgi:hypothetical protein